jgi:2-iminobutanoate/2-iminopropanoate deaminase
MNKVAKFGAYSPVRNAGNVYYVSGQVGIEPDTKIALRDFDTQFNQALENLKRAIESVGLGLSDVVKTTIFLTNIEDFNSANNIFNNYFDDPKPARSTVGVKQLPQLVKDLDLLVEIEAVAYKNRSKQNET